MSRGKGRASELPRVATRRWAAMFRAAILGTAVGDPALLSAALLGACESGDATQLTEGASVVTPAPGTSAGAGSVPATLGAEASPNGSSEGGATRGVALDTPNAAPTATVGAIPDAGGPEAPGPLAPGPLPSGLELEPDAGLSRDAAAPTANDCCSTSASGGCSDPVVAACVCEGDPACCESSYDDICVNQAVARCGERCDDRAPVSNCCSASEVPGCTLPDVAQCICAIDPFCCVFRFDQNCVNLGLSQCSAVCGEEARP
jgi:hypothetical protein